MEAQILRYHHVEPWRIGTIATQLNLHRSTLQRVLAQAGLPLQVAQPRPSAVAPYLPFLKETLSKFPTLTASRLHAMVRNAAIPADRTISATSWPCIGPAARRRRISVCAACRATRPRWIGPYAELGIGPTMPSLRLCRVPRQGGGKARPRAH